MTSLDTGVATKAGPRSKRWLKRACGPVNAAWEWLGKKWDKYLKDPVKVLLTVLTVLIPLAGLTIGLLIVFDGPHRPQVEASFARVGGATRVETAADAARFWPITPQHVVTTPPDEPANVMLDAAHCAVSEDAPLLFTRKERNSVVAELMKRWGPSAKETRVTDTHSDCNPVYPGTPAGLRILTKNQDGFPPNIGVGPKADLGSFVVFAASKDPSVPSPAGPTSMADLPDVAVGLALAAHIARDNPHLGDVSLVVVPEYLEADPALENDLRAQKREVLGGIVLGGPGRISDDTRTLLRQILRPPEDTSILGGLKGSLGDAAGVIAAILALLVGTTASVAAVGAARTVVDSKGGRDMSEPEEPGTQPPKPGEETSGDPPRGRNDDAATSVPSNARNTPFDVSERGEPLINVYLGGGGKVTGVYKGEETVGGVAFMKLAGAEIAGHAQDLPRVKTNVTLIPVANIGFTTIEPTDPTGGVQAQGDGS
jgi:hypothetical protein